MGWTDQFEIHAQTDTTKPLIKMATGSRLEVYGENGTVPTYMTGVGHYIFDKSAVGRIQIQGIDPVTSVFDGKNPFLEQAVMDHLGGKPVDYTNEQLVIAVLVRMLGGAVTITENEIKEVNKTTKITAIRSDELFGVAEPRLVIKVEDR